MTFVNIWRIQIILMGNHIVFTAVLRTEETRITWVASNTVAPAVTVGNAAAGGECMGAHINTIFYIPISSDMT